MGGGPGSSSTVDQALITYLEQHRGTAKFLLAVEGAGSAEPIIIATGEPVMAMGGFSGSDPAPTLDEFKQMVAAGEVHYVLIGGGGMGGGGRGGTTSAVSQWVEQNGTVVSSDEYGGSASGTLYYVG